MSYFCKNSISGLCWNLYNLRNCTQSNRWLQIIETRVFFQSFCFGFWKQSNQPMADFKKLKQSVSPSYWPVFDGFLLGPCSVLIFWSQPFGWLDCFQKSKQKDWKPPRCFDKFYRPKFTENSLKTTKRPLSWRSQQKYHLLGSEVTMKLPKMTRFIVHLIK